MTTISTLSSWMPHKRKQTKKVLDAAATIDDYTTLLTKDQKFWLEEAPTSIPVFDRDEIITGALLARGNFRKIYEVSAIDLNNGSTQGDMDSSVSSNCIRDNDARAELSEEVASKAKKLVMKRLKKKTFA